MSEPIPDNVPAEEDDRFHPEERRQTESPPTDPSLRFENYGDILNREARRDKSWVVGVLGLIAFLVIGAVAVYMLFS